jgi:glycosyltransferase involved in cell wall biosynthesis
MLIQDTQATVEHVLPVVVDAGAGLDLRETAARHLGCDLIVTLPGVELPFAWQERLRKAVSAEPHIAAAVPLCDAVEFGALVDETLREKVRNESTRIDQAAYILGHRGYYETPRLHPVCCYLKRAALDAALAHLPAGMTDAQLVLDILVKHWNATGWNSVICDYLYVGFPRTLSVTPTLETWAFQQHTPLASLRRAVNDAIRKDLPPMSTPGLDARPVQLHVMHFWGGGLDRWVRDFSRADKSAVNLLLATYRIGENGGQRIVLYSDPAAEIPVRVWDIARPIRSTVPSSIEYRRILEQVIREFDVESLVVSSVIGHALDVLDFPVRTVLVCHDYYPVCQAINPMFGKVCESCTLDDLRRCASSNPLNNFFNEGTSEEWLMMRNLFVDRLIAKRIQIVVPSLSVAVTLRRLEPRLLDHPIHVIPHGIDLDAPRVPMVKREAGTRLKIVVLGRLSQHKGTELLRTAAVELDQHAEIVLLGCGKAGVKLGEELGWRAIERYEPADLAALLAAEAPHAGLLVSVVPETFSYTLSELLSLGIPPLATELGSFAERIVDGKSGFLFAPEAGALVQLIEKLRADPALLMNVARTLADYPHHRDVAQMVADYRAVLPVSPRSVARFAVGIGEETALTEPYRHLVEAYRQIEDAYGQSHAAYKQTKLAYEQTKVAYEVAHAELDRFKTALINWQREYDALQVRENWQRVPEALRMLRELPQRLSVANNGESVSYMGQRFEWAEKLEPELLKSPWWIGHIPFAYELIGRQKPRVLVELGTYSGSSFAAFCQAAEACGAGTHCYGVDLWEGDIHMGNFDESLYNEIYGYVTSKYTGAATLVRKDFNAAANDFSNGSIDLLHIDGTHTFEAVSNDFNTWLPKMSARGVILFHDINVNMENTGPASLKFGVRKLFDSVKSWYPHFEFEHCWGLGVLIVGRNPDAAVLELVELSRLPEFKTYFAAKGAAVSQRFAELNAPPQLHVAHREAKIWKRAVNMAHHSLCRFRSMVGKA